jgi:CRP-like cAMP-binding protein
MPPNDIDTDRKSNFVLTALPDREFARMRDRLHLEDMEVRHLVYGANEPTGDVYFPITTVLSMVSVAAEVSVEVATIGREGMAGLPVFLGVSTSPNTVFAQVPGQALRMSSNDFREVLGHDGGLVRQLHRFVQATMVQLSQNVACNRLHSTEQRAARWLLMTADRVDSLTFPLTQDFLAQMLGVRRATVSLTAGALQNSGLIRYRRGVVTIDSRERLAESACVCYAIIRDEFNELAALPPGQ